MAEETLVHLSKWYFRSKPKFSALRDGAACGYGSAHALVTSRLQIITCPECIKKVPDVWKSKIGEE